MVRTLAIWGMGILLAMLLVLATAWSLVADWMESTGDHDYCAGCHSMKPIAGSYLKDVHGGNNATGAVADCVDCHLPHDSQWNHLGTKLYLGIKDHWMEATTEVETIDWAAKREQREEYVYDSGCLKCHAALETSPKVSLEARKEHRAYFAGTTTDQCVTCHLFVGHKDIRFYGE